MIANPKEPMNVVYATSPIHPQPPWTNSKNNFKRTHLKSAINLIDDLVDILVQLLDFLTDRYVRLIKST